MTDPSEDGEILANIRDLVAWLKEDGDSDAAIVATLTEAIEQVIEAHQWPDDWMRIMVETRRRILHGGSSSLFAN